MTEGTRTMASQLVEAWNMGNEANLYVLGEIPSSYLKDRYGPRTRTVAGQFVHIHNVRLRWLKHMAPDLLGNAKLFPRGSEPTKRQLKAALARSGKLVARFLEECEIAGKVRRWRGPPATFMGYLVAHEAHHRGLAMVAMRMCGRKLPPEIVYGQWQWGKQSNMR
jgi:uncharacterized damage-inducible protein DinB